MSMPFDHVKANELAKQHGFTQATIALRAGMKQPNVARILGGKRTQITLESVERIAKALKVPTAALLTDNPRNPI